jgi:hypothetical protein
MGSPPLDPEAVGSSPIQTGSIFDRLARWCERDPLQRENAVLEALAHCRELLHGLPEEAGGGRSVAVPVADLAVLVCAVQTQMCPTSACEP